jgi:Rrf2 family protein
MALYGANTEYALHTLMTLSMASRDSSPSARDLAAFERLPLAFIRKILTQLQKAGLVKACEGVRGGWQLAREPSAISFLDVVDALQGREPLFACKDIRTRCALWPEGQPPTAATKGLCPIHAVFVAAERKIIRELADHSIADAMEHVARKAPEVVAKDTPEWFDERIALRRAATSLVDR